MDAHQEKVQKYTLIGIMVFVVLGLIVMAVTGGPGGRIKEGKFRAKPNTQRPKAKPIESKRAPSVNASASSAGQEKGGSSAQFNEQDMQTEDSLASESPQQDGTALDGEQGQTYGEEPAAEPMNETDQAISQAVNVPDPEEAIRQLEEYLKSIGSDPAASKVHSSIAETQARMEQPDLEQIQTSIQASLDTARDIISKDEARRAAIAIYESVGKNEEAKALRDQALAGKREETAPRLQIAIMDAKAKREEGKNEEAIAIYRNTMEKAIRSREKIGPKASSIYRQAGLSLVRLLRQLNRLGEADAISKEVAARLKEFK